MYCWNTLHLQYGCTMCKCSRKKLRGAKCPMADGECRICWDRGEEPLIRPCPCRGSSASVHFSCLRASRVATSSRVQEIAWRTLLSVRSQRPDGQSLRECISYLPFYGAAELHYTGEARSNSMWRALCSHRSSRRSLKFVSRCFLQ